MNITGFKNFKPENASQLVGRSGLVLKKYSPQILITVGVAGVVTAGVLACRATLKVEDVVQKAEEGKKAAKDLKHEKTAEEYPSSQYNKDMAGVYGTFAWDLAKLYGPSLTLAGLSVGCILTAHGIQSKRIVALGAAYKASEQTVAELRKRIAEEFGDDAEQDIRTGVKTEVRTNEEGKEETVHHFTSAGVSQYARLFDETNKNWTKDPEYNLVFLRGQEAYANQRLRVYGHVFLNEIYDALGMPRTKAGQVVGWKLGNEGDNIIDFGIYDLQRRAARNFVNGEEDSILLDFNVDGDILNDF
ncbi:hypothetical protein SEA_LEWANDO_59 [Arthrobacter phage Lewando]|nr:hypothetical protein SEA_LEWANDO_59 [Arthrobacter phage Lewando]